MVHAELSGYVLVFEYVDVLLLTPMFWFLTPKFEGGWKIRWNAGASFFVQIAGKTLPK